jgi:uncharacterized protein YoxC
MSRFSQKNWWKYSTIGLLAVLAVGFSFPEAFAHVTNNISHTMTHVLDAIAALQSDVDSVQSDVDDIQAKTSSLPPDPASATNVTDSTAEILDALTDIGTSTPKTVNVDLELDPADGTAQAVQILAADTNDLTVSGHMDGFVGTVPTGNEFVVECFIAGVPSFFKVDLTSGGAFSEDFTCLVLAIQAFDGNDGTDQGPIPVNISIQYFESAEVTDTITEVPS